MTLANLTTVEASIIRQALLDFTRKVLDDGQMFNDEHALNVYNTAWNLLPDNEADYEDVFDHRAVCFQLTYINDLCQSR